MTEPDAGNTPPGIEPGSLTLSDKIEDLDSEGKQIIFANRLHLIDVGSAVQKILERIDDIEFIKKGVYGSQLKEPDEIRENVKEIIKSEMGEALI